MNLMRIGNHALPLPARSNPTDLGIDVRTTVAKTLQPGERFKFPTGFAYEFSPFAGAQVWPRSGYADKHGIDVLAGLIDPSYQGELQVILINHGQEPFTFEAGDRIAQVVLTPLVQMLRHPANVEVFEEVLAFESATERGAQGFGSTGIN